MIKSYRIFISNSIIKKYLIFLSAVFCVILLAGTVNQNTSDESVKSLLEGFVPLLCFVMFPVTSMVSLASIYNANLQGEPYGYNYFHSLKNSARHFKNAVVFGNILSLAWILPYGAVMIACFSAYNTIILISFVLLALGVMNLFGFSQSFLARIVPLAVLGACIGAFFSATENVKREVFPYLLTIMGIISVGVYLWGLFHAVIGAKSAWSRCGKTREKQNREIESKTAVINKKTEKRMTKKQKQSGLGFLAKSILRIPKLGLIVIILFSLLIEVLPYIFHEEMGSGDYLFPKAAVFFPSLFLTEMAVIFLIRDLLGNKLVRSLPIAKKLYTRSLPALMAIIVLGVSVILMGSYFVYLKCINAAIGHYSDSLVIGAVICGSLLFFAPVLMQSAAGGIIMVYTASLPLVAVIVLIDDVKKQFGFGIPLYLSIIIFLLTAVLGTVWMLYYFSYRYRKTDVKVYTNLVEKK